MCLFIPWWRVPKGWVYGRRLVFVSERTNKRHHHLNSDQNSAVCSQLELLLTTYNTPNDPISWTRCLDLLRSEPAYNAAGPTVSLHMFATKHVASKKLTGVRQGGHFKSAYSAESLCWVCGFVGRERVVRGCGGGAGGGGGGARSRPCVAAQRSCAVSGPLPRAGEQLPVDCVLLLGGVAGAAAAGLRRMPRGRWGPAIGGRPHRRPPRRRVSPAPFFLADCDGL